MSFMEEYKRLDKLCGDLLNDDRRLSAYIDVMKNTPDGAYYVDDWNTTIKQLKHYRWVRTQIAHEPGCTEENMCEKHDEIWLRHFYNSILQRTDPLSLYRRATEKPRKKKTKRKESTKDTSGRDFLSTLLCIILFFLFLGIFWLIYEYAYIFFV